MRFQLKSLFKFDSNQDPSRFLTWAYIAALAVIAALALGSHLILAQVNNSQKDASEVVYIAGRQRVVAQQVALYAASYERSGSEEEKSRLENAVFSLRMGHKYLTQDEVPDMTARPEEPVISKPVRMSEELEKIYYEAPVLLDAQMREYIAAAEAYTSDNVLQETTQKEKAFGKIMSLGMGPLINSLDIAAQRYQEEALESIKRLSHIQLTVFILLLVTLVVEAVFIFRPLVMYVRHYSEQLKKLALYDSLTGLRNRRAFMNAAKAEWARATRHGTPLCFVAMDIDKFKSVNDTYGHAAGDTVLKEFSKILAESLRKEDVIGRMGGEEFSVLLPDTDIKKGFDLVERLRQKIENSSCAVIANDDSEVVIKYTSSFGLVCLQGDETPLDVLMKKADELLYEAKETGRNKVVSAAMESA